MDKYESRRRALKQLIDFMGRGAIATVAAEIGKSPSYVSRMLYEPGKPGAKRIGEDTLEILADTYPEVFSQETKPLGAAPDSGSTKPAATSQDLVEIQQVLGMMALALAASTPIAGRDLLAAIRKRLGARKNTFSGDLVQAMEAELSDLADTFPHKRSARGSR